MARGKRRSKGTVVNNQLLYVLANGTQYIDIFRDLSALNRKLIRQGRIAYVTDIQYTVWSGNTLNGGNAQVMALPNDWVTNNAWKKAQAHWLAQQRNTRALIGQSAKPAWEDFKVFFDAAHRAGTTLPVPSLSYGEWDYSKLIWEADDNSIDEVFLHMHGNNVSTTDFGLVLAYQQSRATVQPTDPELPAEYGTGMYALLADDENPSSSEIADNMEDENDEPPYDVDDYVGNDSNVSIGHNVDLLAAPVAGRSGTITSSSVMCVPLGLLKITHVGIDASDGSATTAPAAYLRFRIAYGNYKGLAAPGFGQ